MKPFEGGQHRSILLDFLGILSTRPSPDKNGQIPERISPDIEAGMYFYIIVKMGFRQNENYAKSGSPRSLFCLYYTILSIFLYFPP